MVFIRWRAVGASTWNNEASTSVGRVKNAPFSVTVSNLSPFGQYEYQVCGKEASWSEPVCVGPDGTPNTIQKFSTSPGGDDWPQFRYSSGEPAFNPLEFTLGPGNVGRLTQAWSAPVVSAGPPIVADDVAYVAGSGATAGTGTLTAYPAQCAIRGRTCRRPLWSVSVPGDTSGETPVLYDGDVVVGAQQDHSGGASTGRVYAYDAATGALQWTGDTGGPIHAPPNASAGELLVASDDGFLYAFTGCPPAGASCPPLWKSQSPFLTGGGATPSSPAGGVTTDVVGSPDGHLYAFQACCGSASGALSWIGATGGPVHSSPAVDTTFVVYIGSDDGKLYAFTEGRPGGANGGQLLWSAQTGGAIRSSPAVANGVVYVGSDDGKLYAFTASECDACTGGGRLLWTGATGGAIHSSPAVANGVVYVGSDDGKLYAFPADGCGSSTCSPLFVSPGGHPPSSLAVAGGLVYFTGQASGASRLHAYALP